MITENSYIANGKYMGAVTLYGLSTDDKPTNVGNGSKFIEVDNAGKADTPYEYYFDAENSKWYPETSEESDANGDS